MINKRAKTELLIDDLIARRWSPRSFDITKPLNENQIKVLAEAARWAPSAFNEQPYKLVFFPKNYDEESYNLAISCLGEWNQRWAKTAPLLVAAVANTISDKTGEVFPSADYDTGSAVENMLLQATAMGLMAHVMSGFDKEMFSEKFNLPEQFKPISIIAIGHQSEIDVLDEDHKKLETMERSRKPISHNFYLAKWGNGLS